jgi:hypothetical protein
MINHDSTTKPSPMGTYNVAVQSTQKRLKKSHTGERHSHDARALRNLPRF